MLEFWLLIFFAVTIKLEGLERWQRELMLELGEKTMCADVSLPHCAWNYIGPGTPANYLLMHMPISFPRGQCFKQSLCHVCVGCVLGSSWRGCWQLPCSHGAETGCGCIFSFCPYQHHFVPQKHVCLCAYFVFHALMPLHSLNLKVLNIRQVFPSFHLRD